MLPEMFMQFASANSHEWQWGLVHSLPYPRDHPHRAHVAYVLLILFEGFMEKAGIV